MNFLYNISIYLYFLLIKISALFNKKAKQWIAGRKDIFLKMELEVSDANDEQLIWFHCASLGEFEQGRPVIEKLKNIFPEKRILVTFFSPSGYNIRKNYDVADYVFYLPLDTRMNAKRFIEIWNPAVAIFVKYEFWNNYINELNKAKIPIISISSIFRKKQRFFRSYGGWFKSQLKKITYFFVQNKESLDLLNSIGITNAIVSGDTRFDRVFEIQQNPKSFPDIEHFIQGSIVIVAGSTWQKDYELLAPLVNEKFEGIKYIIVPHEINKDAISQLQKRISGKSVRLSDNDKSGFPEAQVLIIDKIGILSNVYQYASVAYVGGGFGKGIHNILEAAVFGMPVFFGPNYKKFEEARELIKYGGAFAVSDEKEFVGLTYKVLSNYDLLKEISEVSKEYVRLKKGASDKIVTFLQALLNTSKYLVRKMQKEINLN
jgi:3-deoxy-D-manno-octulosonic-acid transferase